MSKASFQWPAHMQDQLTFPKFGRAHSKCIWARPHPFPWWCKPNSCRTMKTLTSHKDCMPHGKQSMLCWCMTHLWLKPWWDMPVICGAWITVMKPLHLTAQQAILNLWVASDLNKSPFVAVTEMHEGTEIGVKLVHHNKFWAEALMMMSSLHLILVHQLGTRAWNRFAPECKSTSNGFAWHPKRGVAQIDSDGQDTNTVAPSFECLDLDDVTQIWNSSTLLWFWWCLSTSSHGRKTLLQWQGGSEDRVLETGNSKWPRQAVTAIWIVQCFRP